MTLSVEQLSELTDLVQARIAEFDTTYLPKLSRGLVRIVYDVIRQWEGEQPKVYTEDWVEREVQAVIERHTVTVPDKPLTIYDTTPYPYQFPAADTNGTPHFVPPLDVDDTVGYPADSLLDIVAAYDDSEDDDAEPDDANGALRAAASRKRKAQREVEALRRKAAAHDARRKSVPTRDMLLAKLKEISLGTGVMPSQSHFDAARPALWGTATAQCTRLHTTWDELAAEAGLRPSVRGRVRA